jgi:glycosyltransferase A (GT-A) superfamily protein (DUF2064 family)
MAARCPDAFRVVEQRGADLAARMEWALQQAADRGARPILLRGSDSPTLDAELVASALDALHSHDLVVCPDRDGGYSLIGLAGAAPGLFSHPMSTRDVLEDTLAGARSRGWRSHVLPARFDLDRFDDLRWLAEARSETVASLCPRTLAYLDDRDLWPLASRAESAATAGESEPD